MRTLHVAITAAILAASGTATTAQDRVARTPSATGKAAPASVSPGLSALAQAAAARKYTFLFFWKEKNAQTEKARSALQAAAAQWADTAEMVSVQATSPAEKALVDRYGVSRAPMPLVLAIAPCGAITKSFTGNFDAAKLRAAFVSPCTQLCLKALQDRKLVFLCVVEQSSAAAAKPAAVPQGVQDFKADARYASATEIVMLNALDQGEASLLKDFQIDAKTQKPVTVFLAPPGAMVGKFDSAATKQQIVAKLASAQSDPCAGGKCGPNGCPPKK